MSVIKLRGLPWSCTVDQVVKFLNGVKIKTQPKIEETETAKPAVYLTTNSEGRPSGEAFVEVSSEEDIELSLKLNNNLMGQRYIEIFRSDEQQLKQHTKESQSNTTNWSDPVLRLRGLPYGCTKADIEKFFQGLVIAYDGIMMVIDFTGRFNGEAFVQFETISDAHKGLERHKQKISNRYIEIFRSSLEEMNYYAENSNQQDQQNDSRGGRGNKRGNFSNNNSRSNSSMFINDSNGNQGNNRFNPYARNNNGGRRNGGPSPLMSGGGYNNNNGRNGGNFNNYNNNDNYDDDEDYNDDYNDDDYDNDDDNGIGFTIKMRGLPFKATNKDINEFFEPVRPINIFFTTDKNNRGRPSGECECEFETEDELIEAMKHDKKHIGTRYIELFNLYESSNNGRGNNNNNFSRGGGGRGFNNGGGGGGGGGRGFNNNDNNNRGGRGNNNNRGNNGFRGGDNNRGNNNNQGSAQSLNSLMGQSFNGNSNTNNKSRTPPPPAAPLVPTGAYPIQHLMPQQMSATSAGAVSAGVPGMNNFMMTDMAQKMFTAAYSQFQTQQMQYGNFNAGH